MCPLWSHTFIRQAPSFASAMSSISSNGSNGTPALPLSEPLTMCQKAFHCRPVSCSCHAMCHELALEYVSARTREMTRLVSRRGQVKNVWSVTEEDNLPFFCPTWPPPACTCLFTSTVNSRPRHTNHSSSSASYTFSTSTDTMQLHQLPQSKAASVLLFLWNHPAVLRCSPPCSAHLL